MRNKKFRKAYILGLIGMLVIILTFIFFNINKNSEYLNPIRKMYGTVEDHELISIKETKNGIMVYSVGKVNNGINNMYLVNKVKKSFISYKWMGGGGHVNRDLHQHRDFIFSAQLLNESQNVNPTLFGVFSDENISQITVRTTNGSYNAVIYDGKNRDEKFYVISFEQNVMDERYFMFTVSYINGERLNFFHSR
ncbi:hypothetical protein KQI88_14740 [Alkaliphilus sp. MSJ-5]|uniref:DUF4340 domain-containing protein n=1 Tax=Alkaliphilus flagellatus TaxID=2841507 RepID=A0ABS6G5A6_9FIRM|nr:hypothetical protein [Alkaliphilus flagellatus]MBU5677676.1 hypothetical protein [Alkaliphilus flagellatus]